MQCKNCGANIQEGATFCMNCGAACEQVTQVPQQPVMQQQPVMPVQQNGGMQPNNNKKMFIIIGAIILVAVVAIVLVLVLDSSNKKESGTQPSNSNTQSNSVSNSNSNIISNSNPNSSSNSLFGGNSNSNNNSGDDNTVTVSGGEVEFNGYKFTIPTNYEAEVEHWEYLGDYMYLTNKESYNSFGITVEQTPYTTLKANLDALREELSSDNYYTVGEIQFKNYGGKEYLVVSRTSAGAFNYMLAYVALNDTETLVIDGGNYEKDYELFAQVTPIIESAHK